MNILSLFKKTDGEKSPFSNKIFLAILTIAFLNYSSSTMLSVSLPKFANEMGASAQAIGLLSGIFAMCALLMRPISGQVVDNENKVLILRICLSVMLISVFGLTLSTNYWMLIVFRGLNGLAWGIGSTLTLTLISNCFTSKNMATGIGIYGLGQTLAQTVAPLFALPFAERFGYNNLYYANVFLMILCITLTFFIKVDYRPPQVKKYSINIRNMIYFPALFPAALTLCNSITRSSLTAFLVIFAGTLDISNIALFFTAQAGTIFIFRPLVSKLADRHGTLKILVPCEVLGVAAMIMIAFSRTLPMFIIAGVIMGIAQAGQQPILMAECVKIADPSKRGSASNTSFLGVDIGMFIGSNIAGFLVAYFGYKSMFLLMALPSAIFTVIYVIHYRRKNNLTAHDKEIVQTPQDIL